MSDTAAIILAAGLSRRFEGGNKLLLPVAAPTEVSKKFQLFGHQINAGSFASRKPVFSPVFSKSARGGEEVTDLRDTPKIPLVRRTVCVAAALFSSIVVVYSDDAVREAAAPSPGQSVQFVRNEHPALGQGRSIRLGVAAADCSSAFYMFIPADMPFLDEDALRLIAEKRAGGKITRPMCGGNPGSPCVFAAAFRDELLNLQDGETGRAVIKRHRDALVTVDIADSRVLRDIDTIEEWRQCS